MNIIQEGTQLFEFEDDVEAQKYDDWSHYRNQFQNKCYIANKAVDIIAYSSSRKISWIIEIKDFRKCRREREIPLEDEIAIKVRDTLAGLVSSKFMANDINEKSFAKKILKQEKMKFVLHIEQPKVKNGNIAYMFPDLLDALKKKLKAIDPHLLIVDSTTITNYRLPWKISENS